MNQAIKFTQPALALNYHLLRAALDRYGKPLSQLSQPEYLTIRRLAERSYALESKVMQSTEAQAVEIADSLLEESLQRIAARYEDSAALQQDLEANSLSVAQLKEALRRELIFDAVLRQISANAAGVNELDILLYYEMHQPKFSQPEQRVASHILITVNEAYPESRHQAALARIEAIHTRLKGRSKRFADYATRYSECPTAMEGGRLGTVMRGKLYPELDRALFSLAEDEVSTIVESEMGWHILWCEKIVAAKTVAVSEAEAKIRQLLVERQQRNCQKAWLATL